MACFSRTTKMSAERRGLCLLILTCLALTACGAAAPAASHAPDTLWQGQMYTGTYEVTVDQARSLVDAPLAIRLTGFQPGQPVTLRATAVLAGQTWESWATFRADGDGTVPVASAVPLYGSYTQADPMGLFWSMTRVKRSATPAARPDQNPVAPVAVTLAAEAAGRTLATVQIERQWYDEARVTRRPVAQAGMAATLFLPQAPGPHPAVICLSGSEGGIAEGYAAVLASHGFAALGLGYFGVDPLPKQLIEIPLESLKAGIDWLKAQPEVDGRRIGVLGGSKGGELALLLAATYPDDIGAVVAYKPSAVVWMGIAANPADTARGPKSSWSKDGRPLPFVSGAFTFDLVRLVVGRPAAMASSYAGGLKNAAAVDAGAIPVERIRGPVLLVSGQQDQMWPATLMSNMVMQRLKEHGFAYRYDHLTYRDAGHGLYLPNTPTTTINSGTLLQGGTPQATAAANADAWPRTVAFLNESLR